MSGASLKIDVQFNVAEIQAAMEELVRRGEDLSDPFAEIGEHLLISHREHWQREEAPDGTPWEPLSPKYQARKKKNQDKILVLDGSLRDQLAYDARPNSLLFGTNKIHGATHQLGDDARNIPARPFLGVSGSDEAAILDILQTYLDAALR